ncbi:sensor domain-containing diguanylate cyclase [Oceanobacillus luteolus]|uniref:Sensor domain-containing diguanylate cyclase n=1 Tax=Oceanobacillus luteolus TaxID=1274358 RepID=A0ABW4HUQ2_9BACI
MYFNILSDLFEQKTWDDTIIDYILKEICGHIEADFLAAYVHFDKSESFRLLGSYYEDIVMFMPKNFVADEVIIPESFFHENKRPKHVDLLQIQLRGMGKLLFIYSKETPLPEHFLATFKKETEKLFSIIAQTWENTQRSKNNKFLQELSEKLLKANDKNDVLRDITKALEQLYGDAEYHLILTQEYGNTPSLPIRVMEYKDENPISMSTQVFMTGEFQIEILKEQSKKMIYAPLTGEQSVYGVLEIIVPIESYLWKEDILLIEEIAALSGKALEKTILYEDSLMQVSNLTLINEVNHKLNSTSELSELTEIIRTQIMEITEASEVGFIYLDEESNVEIEILEGSSELFKVGNGSGIVSLYKEKILQKSDAVFNGKAEELRSYGYQSVMVIPMEYSGLSMGFTIILHEDTYHFSFESFKLVESMMQHSALAISNTILKERLQRTLITDFLTQLYTRRYLEERINTHLESGSSGVLLLFDIDDFKSVNDTYGHHVGDVVLKQVAAIMENKIGNKGIVSRWGGEEIAIYLPEMDCEQGKQYANDIRKLIREGTEPAITVSCGISNWKRTEQYNQKSLFIRADEALYRAKSKGKNCVIIHKNRAASLELLVLCYRY